MESKIHYIESTTSTQMEARRRIAQGVAKTGDIVIADEQTVGRGRFGRSWISPRGGLYATVILLPDPLLSLKAGLAVVRVLQSAGIEAGIKWPNDVVVDDRKIAGILIEADGDHSLVGIGINLTMAPLETATCVAEHAEVPDRVEWVQAISSSLREITSGDFDLDEFRRACLTLGCPVRIEGFGDGPSVEGVALDVDDGGRLVVQTRQGQIAVSSGECLHVRSQNTDG